MRLERPRAVECITRHPGQTLWLRLRSLPGDFGRDDRGLVPQSSGGSRARVSLAGHTGRRVGTELLRQRSPVLHEACCGAGWEVRFTRARCGMSSASKGTKAHGRNVRLTFRVRRSASAAEQCPAVERPDSWLLMAWTYPVWEGGCPELPRLRSVDAHGPLRLRTARVGRESAVRRIIRLGSHRPSACSAARWGCGGPPLRGWCSSSPVVRGSLARFGLSGLGERRVQRHGGHGRGDAVRLPSRKTSKGSCMSRRIGSMRSRSGRCPKGRGPHDRQQGATDLRACVRSKPSRW